MKMLTHFRHALNWWFQGLLYLCPSSLKRAMGLNPDKITIEFHEDHVEVKHYSVESHDPLEIRSFDIEDEAQRQSVLAWLHEAQGEHAKLVLVIPENTLLKKILSFPSAAESNLREVLGFELSRKTPFSQDQAYYDHQIVAHDKQANKLQVELFLVPRQNIDPSLTLLREWGITVDTLKPVSRYPDEIGINLLSEDQRSNTNNTDHVTLSLAIVAFLLFLAVLYVPLILQAQQLDSLKREVKMNRKAAIELQKLKDEKQGVVEQIHFLENKHKNTISSVELFNEITGIIPDDTWLTRLVIKNGELQLQGESSNASSLIQIVESSERFSDAQFRSPVTQNNVSGKEKFHLSAKLMTAPIDKSLTDMPVEDET